MRLDRIEIVTQIVAAIVGRKDTSSDPVTLVIFAETIADEILASNGRYWDRVASGGGVKTPEPTPGTNKGWG